MILLLSFLSRKSPVEISMAKKILTSAVQVDVVGMPELSLKEIKKLQTQPQLPSPAEQTVAKKPASKELKSTPQQVSQPASKTPSFKKKGQSINVDDLLKDLSKKQVKSVPSKKRAKKKKVKSSTKNNDSLGKLIKKGNKLSKGSAYTGAVSNATADDYTGYVQQLPGMIKPYWKLPASLMNKKLRCRIHLFIDKDGGVLKAVIYTKSGNPEYDLRAQRAVESVKVYPRPVSTLVAKRLSTEGVILGFPI